MAKAVFRPQELVPLTDKHIISSPTSFPDLAHLAPVEEVVEDKNDVEEYTGPTADDIRREAEVFKANWEEEKEKLYAIARSEAEYIVSEAQKTAFHEIKRNTDEAEIIKQRAEEEAQRIVNAAETTAIEIEREAKQRMEGERKENCEKGREEGHTEGFQSGKAEVERLIKRTQVVLERAQGKRAEILSETEQEIVDLVLLISRKVIKVISENQRNVIISNIIQALRKVKSKGDVIIRVNLNDLQITTDHKQEFIKLLEGSKSIQVLEDSSVGRGGCIIETDFGEIDARISSQLAELESKILEISPFKSTIKADVPLKNINASSMSTDHAASMNLLDKMKQPDFMEESAVAN